MSTKPFNLSIRISQALGHLLPNLSKSSNRRGAGPNSFIIFPAELIGGKPHRGKRFYKGEFALESGVAKSGVATPFDILPPDEDWEKELLSFTWLRDLRALEEANNSNAGPPNKAGLSTIHARSLIADWIEKQEDKSSPEIKARRLMSWLFNARFLLNDDDGIFQEKFLTSIEQQIRNLGKITPHKIKEEEKLTCLTALCFASICIDGLERNLGKKIEGFTAQIKKEILPDGGHISRNPEKIIAILLDFLPLLKAYEARSKPPPRDLVNAVDRMFPMLRFFMLGDQGLSQFNGAKNLSFAIIQNLLQTDHNEGKPLSQAPHSGYHRFQNGKTIVIFDSGGPPPKPFHQDSHASALSFEMSHNKHRLIVNCGSLSGKSSHWDEAAKATAAHSTLVIDDRSQNIKVKDQRLKFNKSGKAPHDVQNKSKHSQNSQGSLIEASHTGYVDIFGIVHKRRIYLSSNGKDLRGEDSLAVTGKEKTAARNFAIRFHIHPDVKVTMPKKGQYLHLILPNKTAWNFSYSGAKISLEDSIYLSDTESPRKCRQIVLHGPVRHNKTIKWALKLKDTQSKAKTGKKQKQELNLPFDEGP